MENGHIESFNGKLRDECLNVELFYSMAAARQKLERWRRDYNEVRPHSSLGRIPPNRFASQLQNQQPQTVNFSLSPGLILEGKVKQIGLSELCQKKAGFSEFFHFGETRKTLVKIGGRGGI